MLFTAPAVICTNTAHLDKNCTAFPHGALHHDFCTLCWFTLSLSDSSLFCSFCSCLRSQCRSPKALSQWPSVWPTTPSAAVCPNWTYTNKFTASSGEPCLSKHSYSLHHSVSVAHTHYLQTVLAALQTVFRLRRDLCLLLSCVSSELCVCVSDRNSLFLFPAEVFLLATHTQRVFELLLQRLLPVLCVYKLGFTKHFRLSLH